MPYITNAIKDDLDACYGMKLFLEEVGRCAQTPGELNYMLTKIIKGYHNAKGANYTAINDVLGALEGAKLEFYRRVAAPYEARKINENGDVY